MTNTVSVNRKHRRIVNTSIMHFEASLRKLIDDEYVVIQSLCLEYVHHVKTKLRSLNFYFKTQHTALIDVLRMLMSYSRNKTLSSSTMIALPLLLPVLNVSIITSVPSHLLLVHLRSITKICYIQANDRARTTFNEY